MNCQACNTCDEFGERSLPDDYEETLPDCEGSIPVGSMIVMAGCTFSGFEAYNYDKHVDEFTGPQSIGYVPEIDADDDRDMCGGDVNG